MRKIIITIMITILSAALTNVAMAGEITYTGRAAVNNDDLRAAQKNSLNNALLGGLRRYIEQNVPKHRGEITTDYFMFIDSYTITSRTFSGNSVQTTVRIVVDDLIKDEVASYVAGHMNSAVFFTSGLPAYVPPDSLRRTISAIFLERQFNTNDQIPFEQEIIDSSKRADVQTAFQLISVQYLFDFKFNLKSFKSGESCTIASEASYYTLTSPYRSIPVISTEVTIEDEDPGRCVLIAVETSVDTALAHVRDKMIPIPGEKLVAHKYDVSFTNIEELRPVNELITTLQRRRIINKYDMTEFYGDEVVFVVETYLPPEELAKKIASYEFEGVKTVSADIDSVSLEMTAAPAGAASGDNI